jgi:hypothetical protein
MNTSAGQDALLYDLYNSAFPREDGSVIIPIANIINDIHALNRSHVPTVF